MNLLNHVNGFLRDDEGQDLIEYALLVALISLVCVGALTLAGGEVNKIFNAIHQKLVAVQPAEIGSATRREGGHRSALLRDSHHIAHGMRVGRAGERAT